MQNHHTYTNFTSRAQIWQNTSGKIRAVLRIVEGKTRTVMWSWQFTHLNHSEKERGGEKETTLFLFLIYPRRYNSARLVLLPWWRLRLIKVWGWYCAPGEEQRQLCGPSCTRTDGEVARNQARPTTHTRLQHSPKIWDDRAMTITCRQARSFPQSPCHSRVKTVEHNEVRFVWICALEALKRFRRD